LGLSVPFPRTRSELVERVCIGLQVNARGGDRDPELRCHSPGATSGRRMEVPPECSAPSLQRGS